MSLPGEEKATRAKKKAYSPPKLVRLDPKTLISKLETRAQAGDTDAQRMLGYIAENESKKKAKES